VSARTHRVYLIPGMFGFAQLAGYDYFQHVKSALAPHFWNRGLEVAFYEVPCPPTSSLRERAKVLKKTIAHTAGTEGPIHILGHSTGGLDARLALAPTVNVGVSQELIQWRSRVETLVTLNTPHFGTPLATYFTTVSGARMLYAISLLTAVSLQIGEPSLAIFSRVLGGISSIDTLFGGDMKLFSGATQSILRFVDKEGRGEITDYLSKVQTDQGAVIQITPEAMDLFNAAVENAEHIRYGCVVAAAPRPSSLKAALRVRSAYMAFTAALYTTLYQFTGQKHERYDYATPLPGQLARLTEALGHPPADVDSDGIVPTLSMLWGQLVWADEADHLDTLGHFHDDQKPSIHTDWLTSGTHLTRERFSRMMAAISRFMLDGH
jgi:triacylglycerol lipase